MLLPHCTVNVHVLYVERVAQANSKPHAALNAPRAQFTYPIASARPRLTTFFTEPYIRRLLALKGIRLEPVRE